MMLKPDIDPKIQAFISKHHVLTLATCVDNIPYTASCFYAYDKDLQMFVFTSDIYTCHAKQLFENKVVAANIVLETKIVGKIQGLQLTGTVELLQDDVLQKATKSYLWKFPYAVLRQTTFWGLKPAFLKLTDNRLGFGKKIIWGENPNNK